MPPNLDYELRRATFFATMLACAIADLVRHSPEAWVVEWENSSMSVEDAEYYRERALVETHLASTAQDKEARKLHAELAIHYKSKTKEAEDRAGSKVSGGSALSLVWNGRGH